MYNQEQLLYIDALATPDLLNENGIDLIIKLSSYSEKSVGYLFYQNEHNRTTQTISIRVAYQKDCYIVVTESNPVLLESSVQAHIKLNNHAKYTGQHIYRQKENKEDSISAQIFFELD